MAPGATVTEALAAAVGHWMGLTRTGIFRVSLGCVRCPSGPGCSVASSPAHVDLLSETGWPAVQARVCPLSCWGRQARGHPTVSQALPGVNLPFCKI